MGRLEELEQRFGFKYPELYRLLYADGMLDYERDDPPLLMYGGDFELLDLGRIEDETADLRDPGDYRSVGPEFQFVPFAMTGAGDLYSFQFDRQSDEDVPVTLLMHDEEGATVLSKNLQHFIFRQMLECVVEIDEYTPGLDEWGDPRASLFSMLEAHRRYLSAGQVTILEEVYGRCQFEYEYSIVEGRAVAPITGRKLSATGLISPVELDSVLQQEIGFDSLDEEFVYMGAFTQ